WPVGRHRRCKSSSLADHIQKSPFSNERAFCFLTFCFSSSCSGFASARSLSVGSRQDVFGLVLASGDIAMPHCRQLETFNVLILFNKNDFGLSRRFKATYQQTAGENSRKGQ
ncbi:hypothetical protein, partial [Serratia liquefaciens]|uniref:hypothetical protein n=1 Tax=Serratia liquefaciens TaxID=614 RepID=UPI001E5C5F74